MKLSFEDFWMKIQENEPWFDMTKMRFYRKDLKSVANDCYIFLLASEQRWAAQDYQDFRKCYQSFLSNAKDKPIAPTLQQEEKKAEPDHNEPIVTGEQRQKYINEWLESVKSGEIKSSVPKLTHKQIADEGDWLPKKPEPYPSCSPEEVQQRLQHLEYIRLNYDARTGKPKPEWIPEQQFLDQLKDTQQL